MTRWKQLVLACLIPAAAISLACEDKPKKEPKPDSSDGGPQRGALDPDLEEAVEQAGKKAAKPGASGDTEGPPQTGVFAPGRADKELAKGAPPKIALGDAGKEPRVQLASVVPPGWKQTGNVAVTLRLGRGALPEISVELAIEAVKPKPAALAPGAAPSGAPAAPKPPPAAATAPSGEGTPMLAKVTNVKVTGDVGAGGKELASVLGTMKGSRIDYRLTTGGVGVDYSYTLAKGASQELDMIVRSVTEALDTLTLGYPSQPVGENGVWLITTRGNVSGTEVISYRMVKLEKMSGDDLSLSVNTKRYAVNSKIQLVGLPPGAELDQFQSTTEGKLSALKGSPIAKTGNAKQSFQASLIPAGGAQGDQRLGVQSVSEATFDFSKK